VHARLAAVDPDAAARLDSQNLRRVSRALEVVTRLGRPLAACLTRAPIDADVLLIGLQMPRETLYARLDARTDAMYAAGFIEEVQRLRETGLGDTSPVRGGVGYKEASLFLDGAIGRDEAVRLHKVANHRLVRRQGAWFKQDDSRIRWLDAGPDAPARAVETVGAWLAERQA
jgi:tRNA dimethylallyltransferase